MPEIENTGPLMLEDFGTERTVAFFCYYLCTAALHVGPVWGTVSKSLTFYAHPLFAHFQQ